MLRNETPAPLIFGEVLFDEFADGSRVLGGAPFNVAWHLQGFGLAPLFISRIGQDSPGETIFERMQQWGLMQEGMQRDPQYRTGTVTVKLQHNEPTYEINHPVAYDFIQFDAIRDIISRHNTPLLYHGSLAARSDISSASLLRLKQQAIPTFVDVNLRSPWWDKPKLEALVDGAAWVKLNHEELDILVEADDAALDEKALWYFERYDLQGLIVTRGAAPAWLITGKGFFTAEVVPVKSVVDTVGAGDAFSAVSIMAILLGWTEPELLQRATSFAAAICGQRGATAANQAMYDNMLQMWGS